MKMVFFYLIICMVFGNFCADRQLVIDPSAAKTIEITSSSDDPHYNELLLRIYDQALQQRGDRLIIDFTALEKFILKNSSRSGGSPRRRSAPASPRSPIIQRLLLGNSPSRAGSGEESGEESVYSDDERVEKAVREQDAKCVPPLDISLEGDSYKQNHTTNSGYLENLRALIKQITEERTCLEKDKAQFDQDKSDFEAQKTAFLSEKDIFTQDKDRINAAQGELTNLLKEQTEALKKEQAELSALKAQQEIVLPSALQSSPKALQVGYVETVKLARLRETAVAFAATWLTFGGVGGWFIRYFQSSQKK